MPHKMYRRGMRKKVSKLKGESGRSFGKRVSTAAKSKPKAKNRKNLKSIGPSRMKSPEKPKFGGRRGRSVSHMRSRHNPGKY